MVSLNGTLSYRARSDGSPYAVINQARGMYTALPEAGDKVGCGGVLYRVDDRPVLLLCGTMPAYRALHEGAKGRDVRQLNRNLHVRGAGNAFTAQDGAGARAAPAPQGRSTHRQARARRRGLPARGGPDRQGDRRARRTRPAGRSGRCSATSDTLHVRVDLDPSQQGEVKQGDRAQMTLPGNTSVTGKVAGFGRVAQAPQGRTVQLPRPRRARVHQPRRPGQGRRLERAPVQVDIMTKGVESALSVPVTALVGKAGGGLAVEVVRAGGQRELVAVRVGLFDTRTGASRSRARFVEGEHVVVPSS